MAGIIIFLILAVGYALCGDTSGIEAIGKIILYGVLFLGLAWVIIEVPWLLVLIVVGVIIWAITSSNNQSNNHLNTNNIYNAQDKAYNYKDKISIKPIENPTSFQTELQQNTKTPQQVVDEEWLKEKESIINYANNDYSFIKQNLLNKAKKW